MSFERSLKAAFCAVVYNKRRAIREDDDFFGYLSLVKRKVERSKCIFLFYYFFLTESASTREKVAQKSS